MEQEGGRTDEELVQLAAFGDKEAEEQLLQRYRGFVYNRARPYFLPGADQEDILQEGMMGLCAAIKSFDEKKCSSFLSFAAVCVTRQILSAIKSYSRQKHMPLNAYLSLYTPIQEAENLTLMAALEDKPGLDMEEALIDRENLLRLQKEIDTLLTRQEKQVLHLYIGGESYQKIADRLGKSVKSVDSTMQRARKKLQEALYEHG